MDVILSLLQNVLEEGFIYGIVAMGVYITYKYWISRICRWTAPFR